MAVEWFEEGARVFLLIVRSCALNDVMHPVESGELAPVSGVFATIRASTLRKWHESPRSPPIGQ